MPLEVHSRESLCPKLFNSPGSSFQTRLKEDDALLWVYCCLLQFWWIFSGIFISYYFYGYCSQSVVVFFIGAFFTDQCQSLAWESVCLQCLSPSRQFVLGFRLLAPLAPPMIVFLLCSQSTKLTPKCASEDCLLNLSCCCSSSSLTSNEPAKMDDTQSGRSVCAVLTLLGN